MTEKQINEQITLYIKGELSEEEEDLLWVEFLNDKRLFKKFQTELNLYDLFQNKNFTLNESDYRVEEPRGRYTPFYYTAAAALLLICSLYLYNVTGSGTEALAIDSIELSEMLGSNIYRDDESTVSEADRDINRALAAALNGDTERAYTILTSLPAEQLSSAHSLQVMFNKGILAYNIGNFDDSASYFSELTSLEDVPGYMTESANWFMANSFLKLGESGKAEAVLQLIIDQNQIHTEDAKTVIKRLNETR